MKFTKMQGIGNDYVYVNCFEENLTNPGEIARKVSDRHFGIGSDGLILIKPSTVADCTMEMYNSDGSLGAMCGNGIRCVAKYVYDKGIVQKTKIAIETASGIKQVELEIEDGKVSSVKVNMGEPVFRVADIPVLFPEEEMIQKSITVAGKDYTCTAVSMGNPHAVIFMEEVEDLDLEKLGPGFEHHSLFPDRVNAEFVKRIDNNTLEMRVWERGAGETMACGTGACAAAVAAILNGYTDNTVTVRLLGGELSIYWNPEDKQVYMTGPAEIVFEGEIAL